MKKRFVGIDLGTTYSVVAYIDDDGNPVVVPNSEGDNTTPSAIFFEKDGSVIVGKEAKKSSVKYPMDYQAFIKRQMGEVYKFTNHGNTYTPESLSAIVLKKLKQDAEAFMDAEIAGAVVTVPAFFGAEGRNATMAAMEIAGIKVLEIINEPTSAAIAYGINKCSGNASMTIMVYDLGGGTFDISIMKFNNGNFEVLATNGDRELGGYDFDNAIIEIVKEQAMAEGLDIDSDVNARQMLQNMVEDAKKSLSNPNKKRTSIDLYINGVLFSATITREQFESEIKPSIEETINYMNEARENANISYSNISKILLVGGSTRIPLISKMIEEETGIKPSMDIHPDEAVAIGAAYRAISIASSESDEKKDCLHGENNVYHEDKSETEIPDIPKMNFIDCTAHGLGIIAFKDDYEINSIIIEKGTRIPVQQTRTFYTLEPYQSEVILEVTQGDDEEVDYVTVFKEEKIQIPSRQEIYPLLVTISYDKSSIVHIRVKDGITNEDIAEVIAECEGALSKQDIKKAKNMLSCLDIGD